MYTGHLFVGFKYVSKWFNLGSKTFKPKLTNHNFYIYICFSKPIICEIDAWLLKIEKRPLIFKL